MDKLIDCYFKNNKGEWKLENTIVNGQNKIHIMSSGKIYLCYQPELKNIELNMDFDSKDCQACYKIRDEK